MKMQQSLLIYKNVTKTRRYTHKQRILHRLHTEGFISNHELHLFSHNPTARITELRQEGYTIVSTLRNGKRGFGYNG